MSPKIFHCGRLAGTFNDVCNTHGHCCHNSDQPRLPKFGSNHCEPKRREKRSDQHATASFSIAIAKARVPRANAIRNITRRRCVRLNFIKPNNAYIHPVATSDCPFENASTSRLRCNVLLCAVSGDLWFSVKLPVRGTIWSFCDPHIGDIGKSMVTDVTMVFDFGWMMFRFRRFCPRMSVKIRLPKLSDGIVD